MPAGFRLPVFRFKATVCQKNPTGKTAFENCPNPALFCGYI